MFEWLLTYFGAFVAVFVFLLLLVEIIGRWGKVSDSSDNHLSQQWVRQLNEK